MKINITYIFVILLCTQNNINFCMKKKLLNIKDFTPTLQSKEYINNPRITNFKRNDDLLEIVYENNYNSKELKDLTHDKQYHPIRDYAYHKKENFIFITYNKVIINYEEKHFKTMLINRKNGFEYKNIKNYKFLNNRFLVMSLYTHKHKNIVDILDIETNSLYKNIKEYSLLKSNNFLEINFHDTNCTNLVHLKTNKNYKNVYKHNKNFNHKKFFLVRYPNKAELITIEDGTVKREFKKGTRIVSFTENQNLLFVEYENKNGELINLETNKVIKTFKNLETCVSNYKNYVFIEFKNKAPEIINITTGKTRCLENIDYFELLYNPKDHMWAKYKDDKAEIINLENQETIKKFMEVIHKKTIPNFLCIKSKNNYLELVNLKDFSTKRFSDIEEEHFIGNGPTYCLWAKVQNNQLKSDSLSNSRKTYNYKLINLSNFEVVLELVSKIKQTLRWIETKNMPGNIWKLEFRHHTNSKNNITVCRILNPNTKKILLTFLKNVSNNDISICKEKTLLLTKNDPQKLIDIKSGEVLMKFDKNQEVAFGGSKGKEELLVQTKNSFNDYDQSFYNLYSIKNKIKIEKLKKLFHKKLKNNNNFCDLKIELDSDNNLG